MNTAPPTPARQTVTAQDAGANAESARAHHNRGVTLARQGRHAEAASALRQALRLRPDYPDAWYNLGNVLRELGRPGEAVAAYRRAVARTPGHAGAWNNLGLTLTEMGRPGEALAPLRRALALCPQMAEAHNNLAMAYADVGRFAEAERCCREALRLDPGHVEAHTNLGNACKEQGRTDEALACYQQALWRRPDSATARFNRALALLQAGDWRRGWAEYEWRWRRRQARPRDRGLPRWDGTPLAGRTILLWAEQGLGDTLQFVRYARLVQEKGGRVVLSCPPALLPLLSTCPGVDQLLGEEETPPPCDVQAPLMSLPALLGTTPGAVPADVPYLRAEPARVAAWRTRLEALPGLRVGVVWQGNPRFRDDRRRSFPLARLAPLAAVPGVRLVSLQKGAGEDQLGAVRQRFPVTTPDGLDAGGGAFLDTAAVMRVLDLVVTADTAAAHLAGALGVPAWLALARVPDWRWGLRGETTPWYPTLRLFRQPRPGDWPAVFAGMARRLRQR